MALDPKDMQTLGESLRAAAYEALMNSQASYLRPAERNRWAEQTLVLTKALGAWKAIHGDLTTETNNADPT